MKYTKTNKNDNGKKKIEYHIMKQVKILIESFESSNKNFYYLPLNLTYPLFYLE